MAGKLRAWLRFMLILSCYTLAWASERTYHTVTVKQGDTLYKIAAQHLQDPKKWRELLNYNSIVDPNVIKPGMALKIPAFLGKILWGTVIFRYGGAEITHGGEWQPVEVRDPVYEKSSLRTTANGAVQIQSEESVIIKMGPHSELHLPTLKEKEKIVSFRLNKGRLNVILKEKRDFRLYTPAAIAAVRGTEFDTEVDENRKTTLRCYEGVVEVSAQKKRVLVPAGFGIMVEYGKEPGELFPLPGAPKIKQNR
ncbi:MAG: FecR domain-containing protein [Leptospiraceae bacterium]|nr:FecR domain-containing protein [Leptospiraceae bacterium]